MKETTWLKVQIKSCQVSSLKALDLLLGISLEGFSPPTQRCSLSYTNRLVEVGKTLASPWSPGKKYFKDSSSPSLKENPPTSSTPESGGVARINKPRHFSLLQRAQHDISVAARRKRRRDQKWSMGLSTQVPVPCFYGYPPTLSAITLQHPKLSWAMAK